MGRVAISRRAGPRMACPWPSWSTRHRLRRSNPPAPPSTTPSWRSTKVSVSVCQPGFLKQSQWSYLPQSTHPLPTFHWTHLTIWFTKCCCLLGSENIQSFGSSEIFILQISCIPCHKCAFATMHTIKGGGNRSEQRQRLNRGQFISRLLITSVCPPPGQALTSKAFWLRVGFGLIWPKSSGFGSGSGIGIFLTGPPLLTLYFGIKANSFNNVCNSTECLKKLPLLV